MALKNLSFELFCSYRKIQYFMVIRFNLLCAHKIFILLNLSELLLYMVQ